MSPDNLGDHLTELAHHYSHSDHAHKAIEYLGLAARQAIRRSANAEAIGSLTTAIDLLQTLPDGSERVQRELPLLLSLGPAFIAVNGWGAPDVERTFIQARELCERLGNPPASILVANGLWMASIIRADLSSAYDRAQEMLHQSERTGDRFQLQLAQSVLGQTSFYMGKFSIAIEHLETAISLHNPGRSVLAMGLNPHVVDISSAAWPLWYLGYADEALKRGNQALALAQSLAHPHSVVFAGVYLAILHLLRREPSAAQETVQHLIEHSNENGLADMLSFATAMNGVAMVEMGRGEEGISAIEEGLAGIRATGLEMVRPFHLCWLADACMKMGRIEEGLAAVTEALAAAGEHENRFNEAESHRIRGELLFNSDAAEARRCFVKGIEIARAQSAKSFELRGTLSHARLLASQGRREEAQANLAEIYTWFTEGFDTADLKDAKALLDELSNSP